MTISFIASIARAGLAALVLLAVAFSPAAHAIAHATGSDLSGLHADHPPGHDHLHGEDGDPGHAQHGGEPSHDTPGIADLKPVTDDGPRNEAPAVALIRLQPGERYGLERPPRPRFFA